MVTEKRRGPTRKRSMTSAEFDAVLPFLRGISDERKKAARLALVDGMTLEGVGNIFGWTRQSVNTCVRVVWREFEAYQASLNARQSEHLPDGWERVTLVAPSELVQSFYAQIAEVTSGKRATKKSGASPKKNAATGANRARRHMAPKLSSEGQTPCTKNIAR